jgi:hypothetical protein
LGPTKGTKLAKEIGMAKVYHQQMSFMIHVSQSTLKAAYDNTICTFGIQFDLVQHSNGLLGAIFNLLEF